MSTQDPSSQDQEAYKRLKKIATFRYLTEYSDYLAELGTAFQTQALKAKDALSNIQPFIEGKTWSQIQSELEAEEIATAEWRCLTRWGGTWTFPKTPTTTAVRNACSRLHLDLENTVYSIRVYAQRNESTQCMVCTHIQNQNWHALAQQLAKDVGDLPGVFGERERKYMARVLNGVKDRFFLSMRNPDRPVLSYEALRRVTARTEAAKKRIEDERLKREEKEKEKEAQSTRRTRDDDAEEALREKSERSGKIAETREG